MTDKEIPIFHNIEFVRRMDALVEEFPHLEQSHVRSFWEAYKHQVYEAYRDASDWRRFKELIEDIIVGVEQS